MLPKCVWACFKGRRLGTLVVTPAFCWGHKSVSERESGSIVIRELRYYCKKASCLRVSAHVSQPGLPATWCEYAAALLAHGVLAA